MPGVGAEGAVDEVAGAADEAGAAEKAGRAATAARAAGARAKGASEELEGCTAEAE